MPSHEDSDFEDLEPPSIDPYEVLGLDRDATAEQVKSAYRKAALRTHPDKAAEGKKDEAKEQFQQVAFAYAVLSDPTRRKRYDETGSTSEAVVDSDGFNWSDYYRAQYADAVSSDAIEEFKAKYKGSDEEREDLLAAYEEFEGKMDLIYEVVMLSNVLEDDKRFRAIIDAAIAAKEVPKYKAYANENKKTRQARVKAAEKESQEADELAKELGVYDKLRGTGKGGAKKSQKDSEASLAALIQRNQASRANNLDALAEKYGAIPKGKKGGKKRGFEEPDISEEQFQALQADMMKSKKRRG